MKLKANTKHLIRFTTAIAFVFLFFTGCRKYDGLFTETAQNYEELKSSFFNTNSTQDIEIKKLAGDIKKQDSIFQFLPDFVKKNGIPKWDKVFYKTNRGSNLVRSENIISNSSSTAHESSKNQSSNSQGIFFIPLQSQGSSEIKSYITAIKHNDSLYSYRLYNKDSLNKIVPKSKAEESNLLTTQSVFGHFEKAINNTDSISVGSSKKGTIKNARISFEPPIALNNTSSPSQLVINMDCTIKITIYALYEYYEDTSLAPGHFELVAFAMVVEINCSGGSGTPGSGGGSGSGTPSSGGGYGFGGGTPSSGGNWWNYGSGWPWYTGGGDWGTWGWWWTGGGGSGGGSGSGFSPTVTSLSNQLGLSYSQSLWLENNPLRANEILNYLQNTINPLSASISLGHIERMMTDLTYLSFVQQHYINFSNQSTWWENPIFLAPFGGLNFGDWAIQYLNQNQSIPFATFENQFLKVPEGIDGSYNSSYWDEPNLNFPPQSLPSFNDFETAYPKHSDPLYDTPSEMYNSIGGQVLNLYNSNPPSYQNTCALRISKALNYSGISITAGPDRYQGADGKYYFISCAALFKWMKKTFGTPSGSNHLTGTQGGVNGQNFPNLLSGKKGIYIMIPNLPGGCSTGTGFCASGHADIINNSVCDGGCYFNATGGVSDIYIWELQ
jgi:hypothetical protein